MNENSTAPAHPVQGEARAERFRFVCERGHQSVGSDPAYRVCTAALWEKPGGVLGPPCGADIEAAIVPIQVWDAHTAHAAAEVEQLKAALVETADKWATAIEIAAEVAANRAAEVEQLKALVADLARFDPRGDDLVQLAILLDRARRLTEHGAEGTG